MNLDERWILPPILDLVMRQKQLAKYRRVVVATALGKVLEIGVGSGLNLPLYGKSGRACLRDRSFTSIAGHHSRRRAAASLVPV